MMSTLNHSTRRDQSASLPTVELPADTIKRLTPLFQQGISVRAAAGVSVGDFLVDGLGIDPDYVRKRITTVFLDGSVVDDMDKAWLREGSCLALSAAMPGLVGATLRKGGYYAAMRGDITLGAEHGDTGAPGQAMQVRVKLFNLLIEEIGAALLASGVALTPAEAEDILGAQATGLPTGSPEVWVRILAR